MDQMTTSNKEPMQGSPIDDIIGRVDSYMKNPKMVTPETLMELKNELMDLKSVLDGEESTETEQPGGGVGAMLSAMKGGGQ